MFWHQGAILREFHDSNTECKKMHSVNTIKFTFQRLHHWVGDLMGFRGYLGTNAKRKKCFSQLCEHASTASPFWKLKFSDLDQRFSKCGPRVLPLWSF